MKTSSGVLTSAILLVLCIGIAAVQPPDSPVHEGDGKIAREEPRPP